MTYTQNLQTTAPAPLVCPNMIAVASGKGGVGKTWLSVTLAQALARTGEKILLFDGDLGLANVDVQLGLQPERDLGGVFSGRYSLPEAATRGEGLEFDIIAGRSGSGGLASLPANRLSLLLRQLHELAGSYDRVILDLGAGIERTVRQLARLAGTCLVVTSDEPTALTDAYAFIKLSAAAHPGADLRIVVNQAGTPQEGARTYATLRKACENFLKLSPPLAGVVRRDAKIKDAIRNQTPLLTRHPNCPAAEDIERLGRGLVIG